MFILYVAVGLYHEQLFLSYPYEMMFIFYQKQNGDKKNKGIEIIISDLNSILHQ